MFSCSELVVRVADFVLSKQINMEMSLLEHLLTLENRALVISGNISLYEPGATGAFLLWFRIDEHSMLLCVFCFALSHLA